MVTWLDDRFGGKPVPKRATTPVGRFTTGQLEEGVREILGQPDLPVCTIRSHIHHLKLGKYVATSETQPKKPKPARGKSNYPAPVRDLQMTITRGQLDRLNHIVDGWDQILARTQRTKRPPHTPQLVHLLNR